MSLTACAICKSNLDFLKDTETIWRCNECMQYYDTGGMFLRKFGTDIGLSSVVDVGLPTAQPNSWEVTYENPGPDVVQIQAFAECAKLVDVP